MIRTHGDPPYRVALLHGGPGAPGTMGPLAELLAPRFPALEPMQTAMSIEGLIAELAATLEQHAELPVVLVGSSWGAMFGFIYAAAHPEHVTKLVLVGSGPFEEAFAAQIRTTRIARLPRGKQERVRQIYKRLEASDPQDQEADLKELTDLFNEVDAFDSLAMDSGLLEINARQHTVVWEQARSLRSSGELLELADRIRCRVVAIHGEYDPHPAAGVERPLTKRLNDFEFVLLENCGHIPWLERQARDEFLGLLMQHIEAALVK